MSAPAVPVASPQRLRIGIVLAALVAAGAATLALALPHSATHAGRPLPRANTDSLIAGSPLQTARCSNWLRASAADKALAIRALNYAVGAPTEYKGVRGTTLSDTQGYNLLNNACSNPIAKSFLIYELYIRAAAFRSLVPAGS